MRCNHHSIKAVEMWRTLLDITTFYIAKWMKEARKRRHTHTNNKRIEINTTPMRMRSEVLRPETKNHAYFSSWCLVFGVLFLLRAKICLILLFWFWLARNLAFLASFCVFYFILFCFILWWFVYFMQRVCGKPSAARKMCTSNRKTKLR